MSLFTIGFGAGFYLVPMYTLLQQRAPKESKGNVIAASNFINVAGGVISVLVFFAVAGALDRLYGARVADMRTGATVDQLRAVVDQIQLQFRIPRMLYLTASILTMVALIALIRRLPDFPLRSAIWIRAKGHNRLRTIATENVPHDGPLVLVTNCRNFDSALDLVAALDRYAHVLVVGDPSNLAGSPLMKSIASACGMTFLAADASASDWSQVTQKFHDVLQSGGAVAMNIESGVSDEAYSRLLAAWQTAPPPTWLPAYSTVGDPTTPPGRHRHPRVVFGEPLPKGLNSTEYRERIAELSSHPAEESRESAAAISLH
ncbi:MAG: hypothetical protein EHM42_08215 [Planctomycetaceae bacterium]|nr:MAG: hypothetical protein EHM42_08215 [Planctomycetaceae bacterium]